MGDGRGGVSHLGERECSLQRRHQKVVELAPSPWLSDATRDRITAAAVRMAAAVNYQSLGTFEFLVDETDEADFAFIEANPRLQVEHTVTEEVTGVDLVKAQLRIAGGASWPTSGWSRRPCRPPAATRSSAASTWSACSPTARCGPPAGC